MNRNFKIADYEIESTRVYKGILITYSVVILALIASEIVVDLKSSNLKILLPLGSLSIILSLLGTKHPHSTFLRTCLVGMTYVLLEIHILSNPATLHTVTYWFPFVPLIALVILGVRAFKVGIVLIILIHAFNIYYVEHTLGSNYKVVIYSAPFFIGGIVFMLAIVATSYLLYNLLGNAYVQMRTKNFELVAIKMEVESKKNVLQNYQAALIGLSKNSPISTKGKDQLFERVCTTAAQTLNTNRASIWEMDDNRKQINRVFVYTDKELKDESVALKRSDYPEYFEALERDPYLNASNARQHPDTMGFVDSYLKPLGIYSVLDCPIIIDERVIGVLCCENTGNIREWQPEDILFVQSLSDIISLNYKNKRISSLLSQIRKNNHTLNEKNQEIKLMNEELNSMNEELSAVNDALEDGIKKRTHKLEAQNTKLKEYAFINSHLLRAPLSRVLGLAYLISREVTTAKETDIIDALVIATNELDTIIRKISTVLYDGNNLTRQDVESIINRNLNKESPLSDSETEAS